ncbi:TetR/AcrR family transcriptional regulator [Aestuariivirga litoralis]|uniref:TetR/AcrR family transcriptional regulator n=1 Tax=Aestuariivirga litoralis TaxID=2650924 RepID=UPI0018C6F267|nr:TetR/AcrR family transcriptional regulator [Aestuariivirga litoralis]MBG1232547.1 TetR/AcrR family transcriptional regulator [Aestuariivirga litoralis]
MKKTPAPPTSPRKPRADALRNRELLVATAREIFAQKGAAASLEEIAKSAGVGIGTLYRHFPNRDDMVDAVYQAESDELFKSVERFSAKLQPVEALRASLRQFVDYMEIKRGMGEILKSSAKPRTLKPSGGDSLQDVFEKLLRRAEATGEIKLKGDPMDLLRAVAGVLTLNTGPANCIGAKHLVDVLIAGLKTTAK